MRVFFKSFMNLIVKSESGIHKLLLSMLNFSRNILNLNFLFLESSIFHYPEHHSFGDSSVWESSMKQLASQTNACGCPKVLVSLTCDKLKFFQLQIVHEDWSFSIRFQIHRRCLFRFILFDFLLTEITSVHQSYSI